jgi:hypothetical protein
MADCQCSAAVIADDARRVTASLTRSERANFDAHSDAHADRVMDAVRGLRASEMGDDTLRDEPTSESVHLGPDSSTTPAAHP